MCICIARIKPPCPPPFPPHRTNPHHPPRYGYRDVHELRQVVEGYRKAKLPLDTLWSDIDHMDGRKDFTFDPVNYPVNAMADLVKDLHACKQQWVPILDPAIKVEKGYAAYESGCEDDVWMRDAVGNPLLGRMWPGITHWPDFMHDATKTWWKKQLGEFHKNVPFDGVWLVCVWGLMEGCVGVSYYLQHAPKSP